MSRFILIFAKNRLFHFDKRFVNFSNFHQNIRRQSTNRVVTSTLSSVSIPDQNLVQYIWNESDRWSDKKALTCGMTGRSYNYQFMRLLINKFAKCLVGEFGMKKGDVIGLLLPNIPEYIIVSHGASEAGVIVTFANPLYTPEEVLRQFQNSNVKLIVTVQPLIELSKIVSLKLKDCKGIICVGGDTDVANKIFSLQELSMKDVTADLPNVAPSDIALLPYSSGTTGLPKGVQLSHRNIVANLCQNQHPGILQFDNQNEHGQEVILSVLPFFHIYGANSIANLCLKNGVHIVTMPKFSPEDYIKTLVTFKPSTLFVVPSLIQFLTSHPLVTKEHLASIKNVVSGAAPANPSLIRKFQEKLKSGVTVRQGYGMTESSPVTIIMPINAPESKIGSCGVLCPNTEAKIINIADNKEMGSMMSGELLVRGPQIMVGYLNNDKATKETIDQDGWLHTGDIAYYDNDRYFFIVDRTKDLIKVKGNQVSPTELEDILLAMLQISDAAIIGVPDEVNGEAPRAFIVTKAGTQLTEKEVHDFVNEKVIPYKRLQGGIAFVKAIPRNVAGKILRNELKLLCK